MNFEELTQKIQSLLNKKQPVVVAISGFGGSGKTTLVEKLSMHFKDSTKLQLDNFLINHGEGTDWQGGYDWERFEQVLKDVKVGRNLRYQWYNWERDETKEWIDQPLASLVIVEGVRILQPDLRPYFDLSVWIDCSLEESTTRGKNRDKVNKPSEGFNIEDHLQRWDEIWVPKEEEFIKLFNPASHADVLYLY